MAATNAAIKTATNMAAANATALADEDTELVDALTLLQDVEDIETALQDDVDTEEIAAEATNAAAAEARKAFFEARVEAISTLSGIEDLKTQD